MKKSRIFISILLIFVSIFLLVSCKKAYNIKFVDYNNEVIKEENIYSLEELEYPNDPKRDGYVFLGWDNEFDTLDNIEAKARYTVEEEYDFDTKLTICMNVENRIRDIKATYKKSLLLSDSRKFSLDLAKLSFSLAITSYSKEYVTSYFTNIGFDNIYFNEFDKNDSNAKKCVFAHKKIDDYDVIAISSIGYAYNKEWANNFTVGKSGNHKGFSDTANALYEVLKDYIKDYSSNLRIWITGYSRGGAISNMLADIIMSKKEIDIKESEIYTYTYEAARGILKENLHEYKNVYNIINSYDVVPQLVLEKFDFYRCGIDIDIYNDSYFDWLYELDPTFNLTEFTKNSYSSNLKQFTNGLLNTIFTSSKKVSLASREEYYNNIEDKFVYLVDVLMYNFSKTVSIAPSIAKKYISSVTDVLDKDKVYTAVKEVADEISSEYEEAKLKASTDALVDLFSSRALGIGLLIGNGAQANFGMYFQNHSIETIYVMLMHYNS